MKPMWIVHRSPNRLPQVITSDGEEMVSDRIFNHHETLVAAAPDLLAALQRIIATLNDNPDPCHYLIREAIIASREAVALAREE